MTRREFLDRSVQGAGALVLGSLFPSLAFSQHEPPVKALDAASIVKKIDETVKVLFPEGDPPKTHDSVRMHQVSKNLLGLCHCSEAAVTEACKTIDQRRYSPSLDDLADVFILCRIWFILMYAPGPEGQKQSEAEYERFHYPLGWGTEDQFIYDYPWAHTSGEGWQLQPFTWRLQGGVPSVKDIHDAHAKLPRRKL